MCSQGFDKLVLFVLSLEVSGSGLEETLDSSCIFGNYGSAKSEYQHNIPADEQVQVIRY